MWYVQIQTIVASSANSWAKCLFIFLQCTPQKWFNSLLHASAATSPIFIDASIQETQLTGEAGLFLSVFPGTIFDIYVSAKDCFTAAFTLTFETSMARNTTKQLSNCILALGDPRFHQHFESYPGIFRLPKNWIYVLKFALLWRSNLIILLPADFF